MKDYREGRATKVVSDTNTRLQQPFIFGYAPRGIVKVVEQASRLAAARVIPKRGSDIWYTAQKFSYGRVEETFYIACPLKQDTPGTCDLNIADSTDPRARAKLLNFDIRKSDFEEAMKTIKSTVDNQQYLALMKYGIA